MFFPSRTAAFWTWFGNNSTFSVAFRAGSDIGKTPENTGLYPFDLPAAITVGTTLRLAAGFTAGTLTLGAIFGTDNLKFFFTTKSGF